MLYLRDATIIDWRTLRARSVHLGMEPGPSGGLRRLSRLPVGAKVLDCRGRLVTKSFVIAHHHLYSSLAVGMPQPARAPKDFAEMLGWSGGARLRLGP